MSISRRSLLTRSAAAPLVSLLPRAAFAAYPDQPIRLICPFAAGGNADLVARIVAEGMSPSLGQADRGREPRRRGRQHRRRRGRDLAAGRLHAADRLERSADRQSVRAGQAALRSAEGFRRRSGSPTSRRTAIVLHNSVPAKTVAELVELSKKQQITLATSGVGSASHMTLARFNAATGAKIVHVPYRGGGALVGDVLAGTVSGAMTEVSTLLEHHDQGKVHILAVASSKRSPKIADVPTMIEAGVKDFTAASYVGVLAPAKTPAEIVANWRRR